MVTHDPSRFRPRSDILVTGFGSFPGAPANPSEDLVRHLSEEAEVAVACLPVTWDGAFPALLSALERTQARHVALFGLAAEARCVRVETLARNIRSTMRSDASGTLAPASRIEPGGPDAVMSRFPAAELYRQLFKRGVPFERSRDAGDYLCNDTLYRLARHAGKARLASFLFVHVPLSDERVEDWSQAGALREGQVHVPARVIREAAASVIAAFRTPDATSRRASREGQGTAAMNARFPNEKSTQLE